MEKENNQEQKPKLEFVQKEEAILDF